jgi:YD repeat-containing protein
VRNSTRTVKLADLRLSSVTDAAGRSLSFSYNGSGLLSSVTLPDSRSVSYAYTSGLLTSVADGASGKASAGSLDGVVRDRR